VILKQRLVPNNQTLFDLVDIFQNDGITRVTGLPPLQAQVFLNNVSQPWGTVSGAMVSDAQVVSGTIYWNEVAPGAGLYGVRWRPNAVGFWRLAFTYTPVPQNVTLDYDVIASAPSSGGLQFSFIS